jgi:S-adenosylmethionine synthetase
MQEYLFSSESVTEGHPDKVCDKLSDSILDDILGNDPDARIACECAANTGMVLVMGEITTSHYSDVPKVVRRTLYDIGYHSHRGFDCESCAVLTSIDEQSGDISQGVTESIETRSGSADPLDALGAGDQGMMFGYATTESEQFEERTFMPLPIQLAHKLARRLAQVRKDEILKFLRPDGKTQVTVRYADGRPVDVSAVLISTQHTRDVSQETIRSALKEHVLEPVLPAGLCPGGDLSKVEFLVNPTGSFVHGGPEADSGLTGRKIIVDTYGGMGRHGGGAFSGKDPSKVDRGAAYYGRYAAKNIVAAGAAERIEVQVAYAIGRARPLNIFVETFGTGKVPDRKIAEMIASGEVFDFRPKAIIEALDLLYTRYSATAAYGHFGRTDIDLPWERLGAVDKVRQALGV